MKFIEQTLLNQRFLAAEIDEALILMAQGTFVASGGKPQEPDFIASLVQDFTPALFEILQSCYKGIAFGLTSVFAHQKPTVNIGTRKNPELGDLLLVLMHTDSLGKKWCNSLLLQAKMTAREKTIIGPGDRHQLRLYTDWPEFTYVNSSAALKGQKRSVKPHTLHDGAQYLMIDKRRIAVFGHRLHYPMACAVPDRKVIVDKPFNVEIVEFLKFKSGRMFEDRHEISEDWSQVVWDLLDLSAALFSKRNNSGRASFGRQYRAEQMPPDLLFFQDHWNDRKEAVANTDSEFAVPVILIESSENIG
jgi:hypothetical protein